MLSGAASRQASVTDSFDRESFNSVEQTFTVVVVSFMVAHLKVADRKCLSILSGALQGGCGAQVREFGPLAEVDGKACWG